MCPVEPARIFLVAGWIGQQAMHADGLGICGRFADCQQRSAVKGASGDADGGQKMARRTQWKSCGISGGAIDLHVGEIGEPEMFWV